MKSMVFSDLWPGTLNNLFSNFLFDQPRHIHSWEKFIISNAEREIFPMINHRVFKETLSDAATHFLFVSRKWAQKAHFELVYRNSIARIESRCVKWKDSSNQTKGVHHTKVSEWDLMSMNSDYAFAQIENISSKAVEIESFTLLNSRTWQEI